MAGIANMAKRERWVAALPMYNVSASLRDDWATLIERTARALGRGTSPVMLDTVDPGESPDALHVFWRRDDVLLSQTCGYPLIRGLASRVQLIGTPRFVVPGCHQEAYSSAIVVRAKDGPTTLAACRGARVACNSPDSHSDRRCEPVCTTAPKNRAPRRRHAGAAREKRNAPSLAR